MTPFVEVKNLFRIFDVSKPWLNRVIERSPKRFLKAVTDVSFEVQRNKTFAIVGESGSGKSTIAKMMVGLLAPSEGSITINDKALFSQDGSADLAGLRGSVQMIFQDPFASLNPRWRVGKIIEEPLVSLGRPTTGVAERMLETVGLAAQDALKFPHQFSGGQRQRICIARALASNPEFIVCDEPTSALDVSVQAQILNLMRDLQEEFGLTFVFISHDLSVVEHMADRIGVLYLGRMVEQADKKDLFENPKHPYTQMLIASAPKLNRFHHSADVPLGEIPDPISPPTGCPFHPRCPAAKDKCKQEEPIARKIGETLVACHHAV